MTWWQHILVSIFTAPCILSFVGGWCRSRCCNQCTFFTDNFNRADSDDPGSYTEIHSSDWDISSSTLVTSSADGGLIADSTHPDSEPNIRVLVEAVIATDGDTIRAILDYIDIDNYWFIELKVGSGAYLRIYQRSSGSNTQKATTSISLDEGVSFELCASIDGNVIAAKVSDNLSGFYNVATTGSFTSDMWGLGTGSGTGTRTVTNVSVSIVNDDCLACGIVCARCPDDYVSSSHMIEYPSDLASSGCCTTNNGLVVVVPFSQIAPITGVCQWSLVTAGPCGGNDTYSLSIGLNPTNWFVVGMIIRNALSSVVLNAQFALSGGVTDSCYPWDEKQISLSSNTGSGTCTANASASPAKVTSL